jgi:hypothetical protein
MSDADAKSMDEIIEARPVREVLKQGGLDRLAKQREQGK